MSSDYQETFLTSVGRIVQGNVFEGRTTNNKGEPLLIQNGPNKGQPRTDFFIAVAFPKADPKANELIQKIWVVAQQAWPNLFQNGQLVARDFSFKYIDGDSTIPDQNGNKPCDKEGFAGNWVFNFSCPSAPKVYDKSGAMLTDKNSIRPGYYVRVAGNIRGNNPSQSPGVYLNHHGVELQGYGPEIQTGPNVSALFQNEKAAVPSYVSQMPVESPGGPLNAMAGQQPTVTTPAYTPPPLPSQVTPAPDFVNAAGLVGPPPPPAAPPIESKYQVQGAWYTKEQLLAVGYTEQNLAGLPKQ